jgi:uncharacterized protein YecE (DUF72 family)
MSARMRMFVGTSGYGYKEWKGKFYPREMKPDEMLAFYAAQFTSVEINNTFYRMPNKDVARSWTTQVPEDFTFVLKAPQKITHIRRLKDAGAELKYFMEVAEVLEKRRGPFLFQFPGNFKKDADRLREFLKMVPEGHRCAFEFRNATWFDAEVFEILRKHNAALCIAESEEEVAVPFEATADWGYLRLRRMDYEQPTLKEWLDRVRATKWSEAFIFFKHEDQALGPKFARMFVEMSR